MFLVPQPICMTNSHKHHECNSMVCGGKMTMSGYITRLMYRSQLIIQVSKSLTINHLGKQKPVNQKCDHTGVTD